MSENFVIVSSAEQARSRYHLVLGLQCLPLKTPCLVSGEDLAWVVTSKEPGALQTMRFGFSPHRSEVRMDLLNKKTGQVSWDDDDDSEYDRMMDLFIRPDFNACIHKYLLSWFLNPST